MTLEGTFILSQPLLTSAHDGSGSFLLRLCSCGLYAAAEDENAVFVVVVEVVDPAGPEAGAAHKQLLHLHFEALAEEVVNHGIVHGGALGKHARQEADFRWDAAAVFEDGPQTNQAVRGPAAQEAHTYQNSNLQWSRREASVNGLTDATDNNL